MNRKILLVSILAALMLITISFSTVVSSDATESNEKKESPLYRIRVKQAISEKGFSGRDLVLIFSAILLGLSIAAVIGFIYNRVNAEPEPPEYTQIVLPTSCMPECE
jgi:hypothetical protein